MSDAYRSLSPEQKNNYNLIFDSIAEAFPAITNNVKKYISSEGGNNSLFPVYLKEYSQNHDKAIMIIPGLSEFTTESLKKYDDDQIRRGVDTSAKDAIAYRNNYKQVLVNKYINEHPAEVTAAGMLDAAAFAAVSKIQKGQDPKTVLNSIEGWSNFMAADLDWDGENADEIKQMYADQMNKSLRPVKVGNNRIVFTAFGEYHRDKPAIEIVQTLKTAETPIEYMEAGVEKLKAGMAGTSMFYQAGSFAMDHSGMATNDKYDSNIRQILGSTLPINFDDTYGSDKPLIESGISDQITDIAATAAGITMNTVIESAIISALAPFTGGGSIAAAAPAVVSKFNAGRKLLSGLKNVKNIYSAAADANKAVRITGKLLAATKYNAGFAARITTATTLQEMGSTGVSTESLIGNVEQEAQVGKIVVDAAQNFLSATAGNKIGDKLVGAIAKGFQFNKIKTALQSFDELVASGMSKTEALINLAESKKMAIKTVERLVDKGFLTANSEKAVDNIIRESIGESVVGRQFRALTTGFVGRSVTEIASDAVIDGASITGLNAVSRELTGRNIFTANTTNMGDLLGSDLSLSDQAMNYLTMQGTMRAAGKTMEIKNAFTKLGRNKITNTVRDLKDEYGLDKSVPGLSINEVSHVSLIKSAADKTYSDLVKSWKFSDDKQTALTERGFLRALSDKLTADKVVDAQREDGTNSFNEDARKAISDAVQQNIDMNYRLMIKPTGEARKAVIQDMAKYIYQKSAIERDGISVVNRNLMVDNLNEFLGNTILDRKSQQEMILSLADQMKSSGENKGVIDALASIAEGEVIKSTGQATVSRKSIKEAFSEHVSDFDVEKALKESNAITSIMKKVDLGISDQEKTAALNFMKHLTANAESDIMVKRVFDSANIDEMKKHLRALVEPEFDGKTTGTAPASKLDEQSFAAAKDVLAELSKQDKIDPKVKMENALTRLRKSKSFDDQSLLRAVAITRMTVDDYIRVNADNIMSRTIESLDPNDPEFVDKSTRMYEAAALLKPYMSVEVKQAVALHPAVFGTMSEKESEAIFARMNKPVDVMSVIGGIQNRAAFEVRSFVNQYGFKPFNSDRFRITGVVSRLQGTTGKAAVERVNINMANSETDAMEYVVKGLNRVSENQAVGILSGPVLKSALSTVTASGPVNKTVPIAKVVGKDGREYFYEARVKGNLNDDGVSNLDIEYWRYRKNARGNKMSETDTKTSVASLLQTDDKELRSSINSMILKQMNNSANLTVKAESIRSKIDFDKWIFNINGQATTLNGIISNFNDAIVIYGVTSNKVIDTILAGTENIEQASNIFAGLLADRYYDEAGNKVQLNEQDCELLQIAATQAVWEKAVKHGVNNKLVSSLSGNIRKWDIRSDIVNTWHNGKLINIDIEYDTDKITLSDIESTVDRLTEKGVKVPDRNFQEDDDYSIENYKHKLMETVLIDAGFVKLPLGFGNTLKNKWVYISDLYSKDGADNLYSLVEEAIKDRLSMSLYPEITNNTAKNPYSELSEKMQSGKLFRPESGSLEKVELTMKAVVESLRKSNQAAIAAFEKSYPGLAEGKYKQFKFDDTIDKEISVFDDDTKLFETNDPAAENRMDVITEFYNGLKDNIKNIEESAAYINDVFGKEYKDTNEMLKAVAPMVSRFALYGAETFSISTPAKRGSFRLISNKLDNTGTDAQNLPAALSAELDKLFSGEGRILLTHSRTQDGMSWVSKGLMNSVRSCLNSFDTKYTNQAIGSKLMTTDTARIAGQSVMTQNGKITITSADQVLEFGSIKGYGIDMARMIIRMTEGTPFNGNAIYLDPAKMTEADKLAVKRLIGNITTHAVLTTRTKEGNLGTQQINTSNHMDDYLFEAGKATMADRIRKMNRIINGMNVSDAYINPALYLSELAADFGHITIPSGTSPAEVMQKLRPQDWTLSEDDSVPFQSVIGSKVLSTDLMYFVGKDHALKQYSAPLGKISEWLGNLHDEYEVSPEEMTQLHSVIREVLPGWKPETGTDKDVVDFVLKLLSNEVVKGKSARMYSYVNGEYFTIENRNPIVFAGQQDFVMIRGIRKGGQGVEFSADAYRTIQGGDYDGDTLPRIQCSSDIIKDLYGFEGFKNKIMERQVESMQRVDALNKLFGSVKPPKDYFNSREKLTNVAIDRHLGALKNYPMNMYELGITNPKPMKALNNPKSKYYMHNLMFVHSTGESFIESMMTMPENICLTSPRLVKEIDGKKVFESQLVDFGRFGEDYTENVIVEISGSNGFMPKCTVKTPDGNVIYTDVTVSSIAGMNKMIQEMSVSNVKTHSVQYFNESVRDWASTNDDDLYNNPSRVVGKYIDNICNSIGSRFGKQHTSFELSTMLKQITSAFSTERNLSGEAIINLTDKLEVAARMPMEYMPAPVRLAVEQWNMMKAAGIAKKLDILTLKSADLNERFQFMFGGQMAKSLTAAEAGREGIIFQDKIRSTTDIANELVRLGISQKNVTEILKILDHGKKKEVDTGELKDTVTVEVLASNFGIPPKNVEVNSDFKGFANSSEFVSGLIKFGQGIRVRMNELGLGRKEMDQLFNASPAVVEAMTKQFNERYDTYYQRYTSLGKADNYSKHMAARNAFDDLYQTILKTRSMVSMRDFKPKLVNSNISNVLKAYQNHATANPNGQMATGLKAVIDLFDGGTAFLADMRSAGISVRMKENADFVEKWKPVYEEARNILSNKKDRLVVANRSQKDGKIKYDKRMANLKFMLKSYKVRGIDSKVLDTDFTSLKEFEDFVLLHELNHGVLTKEDLGIEAGSLETEVNKFAIRDLQTFGKESVWSANTSGKPTTEPLSAPLKNVLESKQADIDKYVSEEKPGNLSDVESKKVCIG